MSIDFNLGTKVEELGYIIAGRSYAKKNISIENTGIYNENVDAHMISCFIIGYINTSTYHDINRNEKGLLPGYYEAGVILAYTSNGNKTIDKVRNNLRKYYSDPTRNNITGKEVSIYNGLFDGRGICQEEDIGIKSIW
jgi:hypothetical protein